MNSAFPRVLVGNSPRSFREAVAGAIRHLRPGLNVIDVDPSELAAAIADRVPDIVICTRLPADVPAAVHTWIVLGLDEESHAIIAVDGQMRTVTLFQFAALLSVIDLVHLN